MRQFVRNNGLSLTLSALFLVSFVGQALTGWRANGEELPEIRFFTYLTSGHFISATFENWESEFLQMATYVLPTVFLFQKGPPSRRSRTRPIPRTNPRIYGGAVRMHRVRSTAVAGCSSSTRTRSVSLLSPSSSCRSGCTWPAAPNGPTRRRFNIISRRRP
jgi:hypothetical protein